MKYKVIFLCCPQLVYKIQQSDLIPLLSFTIQMSKMQTTYLLIKVKNKATIWIGFHLHILHLVYLSSFWQIRSWSSHGYSQTVSFICETKCSELSQGMFSHDLTIHFHCIKVFFILQPRIHFFLITDFLKNYSSYKTTWKRV